MAFRDRAEVRVYGYGLEPLTKPTSDSLVLGHASRGVIGAGAGNRLRDMPSGRLPATDLSCFVTDITIRRGRRRGLDSYDAGSCTITLDAVDRRFDPLFSTGPYSAGVQRQRFRRMCPIVVCVARLERSDGTLSSQEFPLWSGWIDEISFDYSPSGLLFGAEVQCVDAFGLLARCDLNAADTVYGTGEVMGQRIRRWIEVAGVHGTTALDPATAPSSSFPATYSAGPNQLGRYGPGIQLAAGTIPLAGTQLQANALTAVKQAAASSDGYVYPAANGQLVWGINGVSIPLPAIAFGDTAGTSSLVTIGGENFQLANSIAGFSRVRPRQDTYDFANVVRFSRAGGTEQMSVQANTIDSEGRVEHPRSDLISQSDTDVRAVADIIAARHGAKVPVSCTFDTDPLLDDAALWRAVTLELHTWTRWQWSTVGLLSVSLVSGIEHRIRPGADWTQTTTVTELPIALEV